MDFNFFFLTEFEMPSSTVTTTRDELMLFLKQMYTMRRVEITNDTEYKVRNNNSPHVHNAHFRSKTIKIDKLRREIFVASVICMTVRKPLRWALRLL
jgi:hypothetical protein